MAQHDYEIGNQSGSSFRSDLNNCLDAIQSTNSGSSAPSTTVAFMPWADTNANLIKFRNAANDGFITLCATDGTFPAKTFTGDVTLNAQSDLRFADSDSSNFVALQAPGTISTSYTLTLPAADGTSGQALVTDGSGTLSFSTAGGGDISSTAPERTFTNTTEEDTEGGRESKITFKGEQSGGEVSTLAQIEAHHDGTADDQKGQIVFRTNDGSDGSSPTTRVTIDSAGKTGIGTTAPIFNLDVLSGTANTGANANNPHVLSATGANKALTTGGATVFINSNTDMAADTGGSISFTGRNTTSSTTSIAHAVIKGAKENATSGNFESYLAFAVSNHAAGGLVERLRIDSQGHVGIGATSPSTPLHIREDASSEQTLIRLENLQNAGGAACGVNIHFEIDNSNSSNPQGELAYLENGNDAYGDFIFRSTPQSNTTTMQERARFAADGTFTFTAAATSNNNYTFQINGDSMGTDTTSAILVAGSNGGTRVGIKRPSGTSGNVSYLECRRGNNGISAISVNEAGNVIISGTADIASGSSYGTVVGTQTSDQRLKNSITDYTGGLDLVAQLRPVNYKYNNDETLHAGFIAQEVQSIIPESVYDTKQFLELKDDDGLVIERKPVDENGVEIEGSEKEPQYQTDQPTVLAMQYVEIIPALVNSIKELKTQNEALTARVAALEAG